MSADDHFTTLRNELFLQPQETMESIRVDLHRTQIWAEVFWRRKKRHFSRDDPELNFIGKFQPRSILEIGSGYGRVLKKIALLPDIANRGVKIQGIEICPYFKSYYSAYQSVVPVLRNIEILWDDFFKTRAIEPNSVDMIILPMNTLPNFPFFVFGHLLTKVKRYLTENGVFIFSTHNITPENVDQLKKTWKNGSHEGELLFEGINNIITSEFFKMAPIETPYGFTVQAYIAYHRLTRDYILIERDLFQSSTEYIVDTFLEEEIKNIGFKILEKDDTSHSLVYVLRAMQ